MEDKNKIPVVLIVGRVNVGKSTIFNRIAKKNLSIFHKRPGITRDPIEKIINYKDKSFLLVDTGGLFSDDILKEEINKKIDEFFKKADIFLFVMDAKDGFTPYDEEILKRLRKEGKKIIGVVNKIDSSKRAPDEEFYKTGLDEIFFISAEHKIGIDSLLERIIEIKGVPFKEEEKSKIKVIIVGRPNVGKSSLFNLLVGEERAIVAPMPGTTRDVIEKIKEEFIFIDTAGIKKRYKDEIEYYSYLKTERTIKWADCALLLIDAKEGLTKMDKKIFSLLEEEGRGIIILLNKIDLLKKEERKKIFEEFDIVFPPARGYPKILVSALTGEGVEIIEGVVKNVYKNLKRDFKKEEVQEFIKNIFNKFPPREYFYDFYYAGKFPHTFVIETKKEASLEYINFLKNKIRENFLLYGCPIKILNKLRR
ncbi:MAG: ribosome biogenesis GTPase Der [candidate division WOR-3 bacterium]